ncbi:MAG: DNA repair protein RecO [Methylacidiphilales bacterium]|nr:DNA repair protein RecO [Candidatus Methylacidiphilales bacterium]MDW8349150.1 DNA repair protein RecO [Verrucomicrobiae bacterium]
MAVLTTRGLLVRRHPYRETSILSTWFTDECGPIDVLILGANRNRSPFRYHIDLFYSCEITLSHSEGRSLDFLKEIKLLSPHLRLRRDFITLQTARYLCTLTESVSEPYTPAVELSELLHKALAYLDSHSPSVRLVRRFEIKLMHLSGLKGETESDFLSSMHAHHYRIPPQRARLYQLLSSASL